MWSVFGHSVHTNNDVEGWSHHLNSKASQDVRAAESIPASKTSCQRSCLVDVNVKNVNLVKESEIVHQQCRSTRSPSARLFRVLDRLVAGKHNVRQTLRAASHDLDFVIRICALTLVMSSVSNN